MMMKIKIRVNTGCSSGRIMTPAAQALWGRALGLSSPPSPWHVLPAAELRGAVRARARPVAWVQGLGSCNTNYTCLPPDPSAVSGPNSGGDFGQWELGLWSWEAHTHHPEKRRAPCKPCHSSTAASTVIFIESDSLKTIKKWELCWPPCSVVQKDVT